MRRLLLPVVVAVALLAPATALASLTPQPRIVGGATAAAGTWPSTVALEDLTRTAGADPDRDQQICGGTLITPQWVLTAVHCVNDESTGAARPLADFAVMYGSQRLDGSGTRVAVTQIARSPGYDSSIQSYDVALLKLASPVPNASTLPVTIPALSSLWAPGTLASVAGWGDLRESGNDYPVDLQALSGLPIVSDDDCASIYAGAFVPSVEVCAGDLANGGIDTCDGDSGGPLVVPDAAGHPVLIGDTSYGIGCAEAGYPGVYGEIAGLRGFIDSLLGWSTNASLSAASLSFASDGMQTEALTSTGTAPLSLTGAALSGPDASAFSVSRDGCADVVLTQGQTCSVDVTAAAPSGGDTVSATLALAGDGAAGTKTVALTATPSPAPPPVTTTTTTTPDPTTTTTTTATTTTATTTTATTATTTTATAATTTTPSPTPAPAQTPVATPTLAVVPKVTLAALAGHRVRVTSSGPGRVALTFTRSVRRGGRTVKQTLATATATFAQKGSKTITLTLTAAGKAALRHGRHVKAAGVARVAVTAASSTRTVTLTLR